jgi:phage/plasmid-like protein (TIGR03299 family)
MSNEIVTQNFVEDNLTKYGLNYHVDTYREKNPFTNEYLDSYGTYRTDSLKVLKTGFSGRYTPIQNVDAFSVITSICEINENVKIESMGHMNGKPYAKLKFGEMNIESRKKGDIVSKYLYFINSFDGTSSLKFQLYMNRLVCLNGMTTSKLADTWAFSHTTNSNAKVQSLINTLQIVDGVFNKTEANYNALAQKKVTSKMVDDVLNELFPLDESKKRQNTISTQAQDTIKGYIESADNGFIQRDTAWNLYNGVTRFLTHDRANKNGKNNEYSLVVGPIHNQMKDALETINEMVGV